MLFIPFVSWYRISELKYNATPRSLFCELVKGFLHTFSELKLNMLLIHRLVVVVYIQRTTIYVYVGVCV